MPSAFSIFFPFDVLLQGRGIETNLYAQFRCDSLNVAMVLYPIYYKAIMDHSKNIHNCVSVVLLVIQVKHLEVAQFLGGRLYDCVIKYNEFSN